MTARLVSAPPPSMWPSSTTTRSQRTRRSTDVHAPPSFWRCSSESRSAEVRTTAQRARRSAE
eukprot:1088758-Prymnesium_polylepis.1